MEDEIENALRCGSLRLLLGDLTLKVTSSVPEFHAAFRVLYANHPVSLSGGAYDFDLGIEPPAPWRRWYRRNVTFEFSGDAPFQPMEVGHAHALFEWGLNWAIASYWHTQLIIHSAVLERHGSGVLLSATSGSGKSTLSAELMMQGWRLLSDELALIDSNLGLSPLSRPISLKNNSINLIQARYPEATFGPLARDTHKGTIGHLGALATSVGLNAMKAMPRLIVFPKWSASVELSVKPVDAGSAAMRLIDQAFNYSILGEEGFRRMVELVKMAEAWEIEYSSLDDVSRVLDELVNELG